jgi:hypothetical protein
METIHAKALAATLRGIAEELAGLEVELPRLYVTMSVQLCRHGVSDESRIAALDATSNALFGKPGQTEPMSSGGHQHRIDSQYDDINVCLYTGVQPPVPPREQQLLDEVTQLRAQLAEAHGGAR